ncbi:hypothetical protein [Desulfomicrobium baculatum]|uniref:DUF106 domain-containing protein n=1 Tax=Desulfomicrobium baculatum (strain DSM 4028 / VKM B-1378 / X) TaxID=525897 RepID=C7LN37_DESBD|nr:hypothetical protein [Desulfomicrobium baculatum]ACU88807.1 conserved hypothetical protein [Desulfomicrobium baculatum DSM 4028]
METLRNILLMMDPLFIWGFRLFDHPWGGFMAGLAVLSLLCVVTGDFTSHLARRLNRKVYGKYRDEMVRQHNLSVEALKHSDKDAYKAVNRQAHEAFGKYFFSQAGAFTLSIWPLPFAMAWLDIRFGGIPITLPFSVPGVGDSVFYPFFFFPIYIALRILYGRIMCRFPFYQRILGWSKHGNDTQMVPFMDLLKPSAGESPGKAEGDLPPASEHKDAPRT